jgi:hypothetical protein
VLQPQSQSAVQRLLSRQRHEMETYEAKGEERQKLWELDVAVYPPRNHYAQRAGNRRIPVMVLRPMAKTGVR